MTLLRNKTKKQGNYQNNKENEKYTEHYNK